MKKPKPSGMRKYWPHLTLREAEAERQKLSDAQGACCAICGKHESHFKKRLAVDHSHSSGKVRGLLCYRCNKFLVGRFRIDTIAPVVAYLIMYDDPQVHKQLLRNLADLIIISVGD